MDIKKIQVEGVTYDIVDENAMRKVTSPTANNVLVTDSNGQAIDSGTNLSSKQDTLVSGTNIKTINNYSLLGSGNITIEGGGGGSDPNDGVLTIQKNGTTVTTFSANQSTDVTANITVPTDASDIDYQYGGSLTPVQQATNVQDALDGLDDFVNGLDSGKQDTLVSGTNIKTINSNSLLGSGNITISTPTASTATPLMDGTASYGSGTTYARGNHRHPTDTSRQETLVSGTNIKTINGSSILGSGDLTVNSANDGVLTLTENGTTVDTFTANQSTNTTVDFGNLAFYNADTLASGVDGVQIETVMEQVWENANPRNGIPALDTSLGLTKKPKFLIVQFLQTNGSSSVNYYVTRIMMPDGRFNVFTSTRYDGSSNVVMGRAGYYNYDSDRLLIQVAYYGTAWNSMGSTSTNYMIPQYVWAVY